MDVVIRDEMLEEDPKEDLGKESVYKLELEPKYEL